MAFHPPLEWWWTLSGMGKFFQKFLASGGVFRVELA
jgi:hypothetical protein